MTLWCGLSENPKSKTYLFKRGTRMTPRKQQKVEYLSNRSRFFGFNTDWAFGNLRCAFVLSIACSTKEFFPVQFGLHLTVGIKPSGINRFGLHFCDQSIFCKCCKWNERRREGGGAKQVWKGWKGDTVYRAVGIRIKKWVKDLLQTAITAHSKHTSYYES